MTCPLDYYCQKYSGLWTLVSQKNMIAIGSDSNAQLSSTIITTLPLHTPHKCSSVFPDS